MDIINPINADNCRNYVGSHVCAVMHDGTEVVGTIRGVNEQGLLFEPMNHPDAFILSARPGKPNKKGTPRKTKPGTSAFYGGGYGGYGGYGYPYGGLLAWSAISLLFLIPFLFV